MVVTTGGGSDSYVFMLLMGIRWCECSEIDGDSGGVTMILL